MQWALLGILVIGLLLISGRYPKIAFSALGALVFGVAALVLLTADEDRKIGNSVSVEQIEIENFSLVPAYAGSYRVSGRIVNRSDSVTLKGFILNIIMQDCSTTDPQSCVIVGQSNERLISNVPPEQARDFSLNAYFGEPEIAGEIRWDFRVSDPRS